MPDLLSRIDAALAIEGVPAKRGELLARRACYLARLGKFDDARRIIGELRSGFPATSSPRVSIWTMAVEGIICTFEDLSEEGHDRIMRAQTLAAAVRDRTLIAWTSAWRAHLQSERSDFSGMARSLEATLSACANDEHDALARASMVLANAYSSCGVVELATRWYASSRHHALEIGDQATIDALIYNKAAFTVGWLRAEACFSSLDQAAIAHTAGQIASARNYQSLIGIRAVNNFAELWQARLSLLQADYQSAISGLSEVRHKEPFAVYNFDQALIDIELAYCHYKMGHLASASGLAPHRKVDLTGLHRDEQLVAAWLREQMAEIAEDACSIEQTRNDLQATRAAYRLEQSQLRTAIERFDALSPPGFPDAGARVSRR